MFSLYFESTCCGRLTRLSSGYSVTLFDQIKITRVSYFAYLSTTQSINFSIWAVVNSKTSTKLIGMKCWMRTCFISFYLLK